MFVCCITNSISSLTLGKHYGVLETSEYLNWRDRKGDYLLENDLGEIKWYYKNESCIIQILPITGKWVEFINDSDRQLTKGKSYQLLDMPPDEYFYFLDDDNEFVGIRRINYMGGSPNFKYSTEHRNEKIEKILNKEK